MEPRHMHKTHRTWTQKDIRLSKTARISRSEPGFVPTPACSGPVAHEGRIKFFSAQSAAENRTGGADRDRTDDLRLAKPALSQLSYSPLSRMLVGLGRFELPTSRLSGVRSNQLSYRPARDPTASGLHALARGRAGWSLVGTRPSPARRMRLARSRGAPSSGAVPKN